MTMYGRTIDRPFAAHVLTDAGLPICGAPVPPGGMYEPIPARQLERYKFLQACADCRTITDPTEIIKGEIRTLLRRYAELAELAKRGPDAPAVSWDEVDDLNRRANNTAVTITELLIQADLI